MVVESTSPQTLNSKKKPNKKTSSKFSKSKFSCHSIELSIPEQPSTVKMRDLSPNYMKITTSYDAKIGSSSQDDKIKDRLVMKKIMKNFGSTRSFRRRSSRSITAIKNHNPAKSPSDFAASPQNQSSVDQFSESSSSPHYRKSTSCSNSSLNHSCESSFDSSDQSGSSQKYMQTLSRTISMRSVKILINKASFKSKRGTSKRCQNPDKATCSLTIKDSKFKEHVEFHPGQTESDRMSKFKVCSYHHCSLYGGHYNDPSPPVKRVYRRKRLLKSQKSIRAKRALEQKENLLDFGEKQSSGAGDAAFFKVKEAIVHADLAQSDEETFNIISKYFAQDQGNLLTASKCCNYDGVTASAVSNYQDRNRSLLLKEDNSVPTSGEDKSSKRELSKNGPSTISTRPVFDLFNGAKCSNVTASAVTSGKDESNKRELSKDGSFTIRARPVLDISYGSKFSNEISCISASNIQQKLGAMQDKGENADKKEDLNSTSGPVSGSESKNNPPVEVAEPKKKYVSMWSLIRMHMVSDASVEKTHQDGANKSPSAESSDSCSDFAKRELIPANKDAESQEIELRRLFTIKLVREPIEKILLPEVQSDNQSVTSESSVDQESFERSYSLDIKNEDTDAGSRSKTPNTEDIGGSKKEITQIEVKNKSDKRGPKHWINLKKWILLQRFVKKLEKVRKINPRKPHFLYQLAPTQQRKVELLIKAFETVVPPQEDNSQIAFSKLEAVKENEFVSMAGNMGCKAEKVIAGIDRKHEENDCSAYKGPDVRHVLKAEDVGEEKTGKEDQEDSSNDSSKEIPSSMSILTDTVDGAQEDVGLVVRDRKLELENHDGIISETTNATQISIADGEKDSLTEMSTQSSTLASDAAMQEHVAMEETTKECEKTPKRVRGFSLLLSMSGPKEEDGPSKGQADKRSYIKMWHMISQHVLSDVASKVGNELLDGIDDEDFSKTKDDADTIREDHNPRQHERSFCRDDAIKLIREAVNNILTTPIQDDSSDIQSVTSDLIPDQELSEAEGEALNSSTSKGSLIDIDMAEGGKMLDQEMKDPEEERALPLNWSKLKKLILLKRSIKVLQRARNFNPRAPELLPLTPDQEPEKVDLRHQMTDERKKAGKWMLDYTMQNIVTTLTPARKRRVAMLVEAFEAIVPLPEK
ncbi:unnamed protein product [Withania somnifera]